MVLCEFSACNAWMRGCMNMLPTSMCDDGEMRRWKRPTGKERLACIKPFWEKNAENRKRERSKRQKAEPITAKTAPPFPTLWDWLTFGFWWFVQITLTAGQERKELEWRGSSRVSTVAELQRQRWLHNNTRIRMIVSILPAWAFGWMRTSVKSKTQEIWANVKRAKVR